MGQVWHVGKEAQWAFRGKDKARKVLAGLEAGTCPWHLLQSVDLGAASSKGKQAQNLKVQLWEGELGRDCMGSACCRHTSEAAVGLT